MNNLDQSSKLPARWAGICLLVALAGLAATFSVMPSFDARAEYFAGWLPGLVMQRFQYGMALGLSLLTGGLALAAGAAIYRAFRTARGTGIVSGFLFEISGAGFMLSALLGLPLLRILFEVSGEPSSDWSAFASAAYPWASANQATLVMIGLGGFAAGLLATAASLILAGGVPARVALILALAPLLPLAISLIIPGEDPYFLLGIGLASLVWSISLGGYLVVSGRVSRV
jgi:hypothetical protein